MTVIVTILSQPFDAVSVSVVVELIVSSSIIDKAASITNRCIKVPVINGDSITVTVTILSQPFDAVSVSVPVIRTIVSSSIIDKAASITNRGIKSTCNHGDSITVTVTILSQPFDAVSVSVPVKLEPS